jgi:glutamyl-tRNA synthetase
LLLQDRLGLDPPLEYFHLPLVVGEDGRRLAKRHGDTRLSHYRAQGVTRERMLGLLAEWCGLGQRRELSPQAFLDTFKLELVPRERIAFRSADDVWLLALTLQNERK